MMALGGVQWWLSNSRFNSSTEACLMDPRSILIGASQKQKKVIIIKKKLVFHINVVEGGKIFTYGVIYFFCLFKTKTNYKSILFGGFLEHLLSCFERTNFFFTVSKYRAFHLKISRKMDDRDMSISSI